LLKQAAELVPQQQTGVRRPPGPIVQGQASLALAVAFSALSRNGWRTKGHQHRDWSDYSTERTNS
jgi:hypothetical protein